MISEITESKIRQPLYRLVDCILHYLQWVTITVGTDSTQILYHLHSMQWYKIAPLWSKTWTGQNFNLHIFLVLNLLKQFTHYTPESVYAWELKLMRMSSGSPINFEVLQNLQRSFVLVHNSYDGAHLNLDLLSLASPCMLTLKMRMGTPIITTPLQCLLSLCFLMLSWMKSCLMW